MILFKEVLSNVKVTKSISRPNGEKWHISEVGWRDKSNDVGLLSNHGLIRPHMNSLRCEHYSQCLKIHTKKKGQL
jgi:hypothetical protein